MAEARVTRGFRDPSTGTPIPPDERPRFQPLRTSAPEYKRALETIDAHDRPDRTPTCAADVRSRRRRDGLWAAWAGIGLGTSAGCLAHRPCLAACRAGVRPRTFEISMPTDCGFRWRPFACRRRHLGRRDRSRRPQVPRPGSQVSLCYFEAREGVFADETAPRLSCAQFPMGACWPTAPPATWPSLRGPQGRPGQRRHNRSGRKWAMRLLRGVTRSEPRRRL